MRSARLIAGILGLVATVSFASIAPAQDEEADPQDLFRDGWYVGAQYAFGLEEWNLPDFPPPGTAVENSHGVSVYAGWRFLKWWGIDFQYEWQNQFATLRGAVAGGANAHVITLNGRFYFPFMPIDRVQPFGLAGLGLFQTTRTKGSIQTQRGDFTGRFGGGIDFYITKNWVIEGSGTYVLPTGEQNDQRYWSFGAGLQYRFAPYIY